MNRRRIGLVALGAAGFLLLAPVSAALASSGGETPVTAPAPSQAAGPPASTATLQTQDLATINADRASAGVGPVALQPWATTVATQHSQDMAAAQTIFHNITGYMDTGHQAMGAVYLGENVGMDSTLGAVEQLLMADPAHRAILLNPRFNYVGVGVALDSRNWIYLTEDFAEIQGGATHVAPVPAPVHPAAAAPAAPKPVVVAKPAPAPQPAPVVLAPVPVVAVAPVPVVAAPAPAPAPAKPVRAPVAAAPVSHTFTVPVLGLVVGILLTAGACFGAASMFSSRLGRHPAGAPVGIRGPRASTPGSAASRTPTRHPGRAGTGGTWAPAH